MKGRIYSILLILCLVVPATTTFLILQFQKHQLKREVKWKMISGIHKDELVLLKFQVNETKTQLRWEHSMEFEYQDQMYDVVKKEIKGDSIYYWCWWDHKETKLNKQLDQMVAFYLGLDDQLQDNQKKVEHYNQSLFYHPLCRNIPSKLGLKKTIFLFELHVLTVSQSPPVPPPENC